MRLFIVRINTRDSGAVELTVPAHDDYQARHAAARRFEDGMGLTAYSTEVISSIAVKHEPRPQPRKRRRQNRGISLERMRQKGMVFGGGES